MKSVTVIRSGVVILKSSSAILKFYFELQIAKNVNPRGIWFTKRFSRVCSLRPLFPSCFFGSGCAVGPFPLRNCVRMPLNDPALLVRADLTRDSSQH